MAKKKQHTGGAADAKRRGMRNIVTPLTPRQHALVQRAAGLRTGIDRAVTRWAAEALEAAALAQLAEAGVEVPAEENPE